MIFITGHRGYIGSRLYGRLKEDGQSVNGMDLEDGQDILSDSLPNQPEVVYHLAAQAGAIPSIKNPIDDAFKNIIATIRIATHYQDTKVIFTTSGAALDPESPYGISKRAAEDYLRVICDNAVILRLSSVYGEKDRGVVDTFIREDKCTIYGDGSAVRDFVHVDDVVQGLIQAKYWDPGIYTMGSGKGTSVQELAEATGKEIEYRPAREGEKQEVVLQNTTEDWLPDIDVIDYIKEKCNKK